jgi:two-component system chemotaxis response regulator CheY
MVHVPVVSRAERVSSAPVSNRSNGVASRRVLVVDDDEAIRDLLDDVLELEGYEARCAADGEAALVAASDWTPDVIVLDLMMPKMDGWQFREAQLALPHLRNIPVVVISASQRARDAYAELGAAAVIAKPFDLDDLIGTIGRLASQHV